MFQYFGSVYASRRPAHVFLGVHTDWHRYLNIRRKKLLDQLSIIRNHSCDIYHGPIIF